MMDEAEKEYKKMSQRIHESQEAMKVLNENSYLHECFYDNILWAKKLTQFHGLLLGFISRVFSTWTGECISRYVHLAMTIINYESLQDNINQYRCSAEMANCTGSDWLFMIRCLFVFEYNLGVHFRIFTWKDIYCFSFILKILVKYNFRTQEHSWNNSQHNWNKSCSSKVVFVIFISSNSIFL